MVEEETEEKSEFLEKGPRPTPSREVVWRVDLSRSSQGPKFSETTLETKVDQRTPGLKVVQTQEDQFTKTTPGSKLGPKGEETLGTKTS